MNKKAIKNYKPLQRCVIAKIRRDRASKVKVGSGCIYGNAISIGGFWQSETPLKSASSPLCTSDICFFTTFLNISDAGNGQYARID